MLGAVLLLLVSAGPVLAQEATPELSIRLTRDLGYGGFDAKIEGRFSMRVRDADGFARIDFYIDDELIESRSEEPFSVQFRTENYAPGQHQLYAIGTTDTGMEVRSNEFSRVFIAPDEVGQNVLGLIIPILAIAAVAFAVSTFLPRLLGRKQGFELGNYGPAGAAVCTNCAKPFGRKVMSPNLVVGKLERCPHCGKWQIAGRAGADALATAEALLREEQGAAAGTGKKESEEEKLRRQIEESRFN